MFRRATLAVVVVACMGIAFAEPSIDNAAAPASGTDSISKTVEASLGVSSGVAQVLTWVAILAVLYVIVQMVQGVVFGGGKKKRRQRGQMLLLLGQNNAGKTALYYQLKEQVEVKLVSSLKVNREKLRIKVGDKDEFIGPIETIDCPGHQRFRGKQADFYPDARCIVYLVDAEDKLKLKDVAEHLYEILTCQEVIELHIPILLACNKCELASARSEKAIIEELEREMERMRASRGAVLEGQDQADSYLGIDGEKFKLVEHSPCPIDICRISCKKPDLAPVYEFLQQQFSS